jgi:hypothetical protein
MTIMLAGGMVIAAPSMVPEAAAAGQLYVSAENPTFGNLFGGAQIVEIIVRDPNRADTEVAESEPTVRVDNHLVRMAQGADGYWYAYIGSDTEVTAADTADNHLQFGFEGAASTGDGASLSGNFLGQDSIGVNHLGNDGLTTSALSVFMNATIGVITNPPTLSDYNHTLNVGTGDNHIKTMNYDQSSTVGQIGLNSTEWPFIQTFDLRQGEFDIILEQAGADEVVTLDYNSGDLDDYSSLTLDRNSATQGAEVHLTILDNQLNIDPTNEDVVVFFVSSDATLASVSFTNGTVPESMDVDNTGRNNYKAYDNYFSDNGKLVINYDAAGAGTDVFVEDATVDDAVNDKYFVFFEGADNSGEFFNTDDLDNSNLDVNKIALRGTSATLDYNDSAQTFVVANDFASIDMDESTVGDEWNSGEELTVTLIDQDLNFNTISDEDFSLSNTTNFNTLVPSLKIGSPLMVTASAGTTYDDGMGAVTVDSFSNIARYTNATGSIGNTANYSIATGYDSDDLTAIATDQTYFNYDFSAFITGTETVSGVCLVDSGSATFVELACDGGNNNEGSTSKGLVKLFTTTATGNLQVEVMLGADDTQTNRAFVADVFSFGDRTNNAIYRLLLEETGDNTAEFVGSVEYIMLNQLNVDQDSTYLGLDTISDAIDIIVHEDLTDEDSPRINYLDMGADGVNTQIADQVAAPSHSGVVSFDSENYKIADTVVVTLDDQDLNTDSELIDVYITADDNQVGDGSGDHVLDITFDDNAWGALQGTGFTLVETGVDSGIFTGSFQVPENYTGSTTTTGTDIEVNY